MRDNRYHHYQTQRHPDYSNQSINQSPSLSHSRTNTFITLSNFYHLLFSRRYEEKTHASRDSQGRNSSSFFHFTSLISPKPFFLLRFYFISKPPRPPFSLFALSVANAAAAAVFIIMSVLAGLVGHTTPPIGSILQQPNLIYPHFFVTLFCFSYLSLSN